MALTDPSREASEGNGHMRTFALRLAPVTHIHRLPCSPRATFFTLCTRPAFARADRLRRQTGYSERKHHAHTAPCKLT